MYNFVTNHIINKEFKKSKYYKTDLGRSLSVTENDRRVFRLNDDSVFINFYLTKYNIVIYNEGNVGQLNFLCDHYIKGNIIMVFRDEVEFIFEHDPNLLRTKGIDGYIGSFIEDIETKHNDEIEDHIGMTDDVVVDLSNIKLDPGNVSYEDIKKYYASKLPKK